ASKRSWEEVLSLYRERDEVEKKFDDLKNELEVMPLRVQKVETLKGLQMEISIPVEASMVIKKGGV
ncbi:MAG TPA: hypothetical protein VF300_00980, partial [Methanothrix sp.]